MKGCDWFINRHNQIIKNYVLPNFYSYYGVGNNGILLAPHTKCVILTPNNMLIKQESFGPISNSTIQIFQFPSNVIEKVGKLSNSSIGRNITRNKIILQKL